MTTQYVVRLLISMGLMVAAGERAERCLAAPADYFAIEVVDEQTGRGVPMVELQTTSSVTYITDSNGLIAFDEPGLMNRKVWFGVSSHGYEFAADGFGIRGVALETKPGGTARLKIKRINIAERLYRMTGQGIYRDTVLLGRQSPIAEPLLNGEVTGQDGILTAEYRGKTYWFYGDTGRLAYALGNFKMTGATSEPPDKLDPSAGISLKYFTGTDGFARQMAPIPGDGVVWLGGLVVVPDESGARRMMAFYQRRAGLGPVHESGFVVYDDAKETFEKVKSVAVEPPICPTGYPLQAKDAQGAEYLYFTAPYPFLRVKAEYKSYLDLSVYEGYTCVKPGTTYSNKDDIQLDRDASGKLVWGWKRNTRPLNPKDQQDLVAAGKMKREESPFRLQDVDGGKPILLNNCSCFWNEYRKRYIMIASEVMGATMLGEVWYSESDRPEGPWVHARKIITHANKKNDAHDFYNPTQHPFLDRQGGRVIYLEGSYVNTFSGNPHPTPYYEYNQIMYRLDLADPRLKLPGEVKRQQDIDARKAERRRFQDQELITAKPLTFIFNAGDPPQIVWRDVNEVRRMGADGTLRVRWFDADLNETQVPKKPGRWGAYIEGKAPNGTPVRRGMTFFCRPPGFLCYFPTAPTTMPYLPGPIAQEVWREHQDEITRLYGNQLFRLFNDTEAAMILIAGLSEAKPAGRAPLAIESAAVRNDDYHLALKLKLLGLQDKVRPLKPPRRRANPAPALREGTAAEAGVRPDAKAKIEALCRDWAQDSKEPFATLVARNGVIILHQAFGRDKDDKPIALDYRCDVFSITKSVTAILFSQFLDQGLIGLDDPIGRVFPDYPGSDPHVPTFRQCLTHTSGLSGHGDWGGVRNPYLDNIVLNGIDVNEPGKAYNYSGMGFDLAAEAMEMVTGKSALHLYRDHLYEPLGLGDVPMDNASAGAQFTARELGTLAQWLANRGSYGDMEFISPATFEKMLPEPLGRRYPGVTEEEGLGNHWLRHVKPGAPADSTRAADLIFSPRTIGLGSLSSCIFLVDLDRNIIVTQIRKTAGPRFGEWSQKFFQAAADAVLPGS